MEGGFKSIMHLSYRDYRSVPEELRDPGSGVINEIYLKENLIHSLPDWFCAKMAHLRFLCLAGNKIVELPNEIGYLVCLETLDLSDNELQYLPNTIGRLSKLTKLMINGNKLLQLPAEIGLLCSLQVLEIRKNRLTNIPIQLSRCRSLEDLFMDDNPGLVSIPTRLFNLPALCYVSAERCNLFQLPFVINTATLAFVRLFSNNYSLTHCPLALERFAQPDYDSVQDRQRRIRNPRCYQQIRCLPVPYRLNFPKMHLISRGAEARPNTLVEESLRAFIRNGFPLEMVENLNLPHCLRDWLLHGPVACCASVPCGRILFTQAVLALVKRKEYARNFLLSVLFCSKLCADRWFQYNCDAYDELPWEASV